MPSSCQLIEDVLKSNIKKKDINLDSQIQAFSRKILNFKIEFIESKNKQTPVDQLKKKYTSLNPQSTPVTVNRRTVERDEAPIPKVILYPSKDIKMEWSSFKGPGGGLDNMGNTCFMNSVLQILTYTPPLANYINSGAHKCKSSNFCMLCELVIHVRRINNSGNSSIRPINIIHKLKDIARHFMFGRQEDAHEFLRYVINSCQNSCLRGHKDLDRFSKETTVIGQIFSGLLRSQVLCTNCHHRSNTFETFMDISLDVKNANTIERSLEYFTRTETLCMENAYKCSACKKSVMAKKRFSIHHAPNILTLQMKRFNPHSFFGKISRQVGYADKLDLRPYMSVKTGEPIIYRLYGVLIHSGLSMNSGHYYCFIKSSNKMWYCMNDSFVENVSLNKVLNNQSYLLFYTREKPSTTVATHQKSSPLSTYPSPQKVFSPVKPKGPRIISEKFTMKIGKKKNIIFDIKSPIRNHSVLFDKSTPNKKITNGFVKDIVTKVINNGNQRLISPPKCKSSASSSMNSQDCENDLQRSRDLSSSCSSLSKYSTDESLENIFSSDSNNQKENSSPYDQRNETAEKYIDRDTKTSSPRKDFNGTKSPCKDLNGTKSPCKDLNGTKSHCKDLNGTKSPCKDFNIKKSPCKDFNSKKSPCKNFNGKKSPCKDFNDIELSLKKCNGPILFNGLKSQNKDCNETKPPCKDCNGTQLRSNEFTYSKRGRRNRNKRRNIRNKKEAEKRAKLEGECDYISRKRKAEDYCDQDQKKKKKMIWVEKTKESIEQDWDKHINIEKTPTETAFWYGIPKKSNPTIVKDLLTGNRSFGTMGSNVEGWDGGANENDKSLLKERQQIIKDNRAWEKIYDQDIDSGKTKKYKKHNNNIQNNKNLFQKLHEKNKSRNLK